MSWISDGHAEWHAVNGKYATCPLDCGANEPFASQCSVCGEFTYEFPSDPGNPAIGCSNPAACNAAKPALEPVTVPANPDNNQLSDDFPF